MNCDEVLNKLSAFIDNMLDDEENIPIKAHLSKCEKCTQEYKRLEALVNNINSLEKVKAPLNFAQNVNKRINEVSVFKKILRNIFVPLEIKLPLELAGCLVILLLVFYGNKDVLFPNKNLASLNKISTGKELKYSQTSEPAICMDSQARCKDKEDAAKEAILSSRGGDKASEKIIEESNISDIAVPVTKSELVEKEITSLQKENIEIVEPAGIVNRDMNESGMNDSLKSEFNSDRGLSDASSSLYEKQVDSLSKADSKEAGISFNQSKKEASRQTPIEQPEENSYEQRVKESKRMDSVAKASPSTVKMKQTNKSEPDKTITVELEQNIDKNIFDKIIKELQKKSLKIIKINYENDKICNIEIETEYKLIPEISKILKNFGKVLPYNLKEQLHKNKAHIEIKLKMNAAVN